MQGATSKPDTSDAPYPAIPLFVKTFQGAEIEKVVWAYFGGRRVDPHRETSDKIYTPPLILE
jgi:hypothetical protein